MSRPAPGPGDRDAAFRRRRLYAWGVHLFTASGAILGVLALLAATRSDFTEMFAWLGLALFVDGIDGTMARKVGVGEVLPRVSGVALDLVVDYLTYVVVPAFALVQSDLVAPGWDIAAAGLICLSSAIYFADSQMKTHDDWFRGFPAVWNLVVFYLFLWKPGSLAALVVIVVLAAASFAPIVFVHPLRVEQLRWLTLLMLAAACVAAIAALLYRLEPPLAVHVVLGAAAVYFLGLGAVRGRRAPQA